MENNIGLIDRFADPELLSKMSMNEKLMGSLIVTCLGMLITFVVLMLLWGLIAIMTKMFSPKQKTANNTIEVVEPSIGNQEEQLESEEELVAVISAAIASSLKRPVETIFVRKIKRIADTSPTWRKVAKNEQLDSSRF